jgi:hypothetical protein
MPDVPDLRGRTDFEFFDYWYQNERKIDALFSDLNGRVEKERKETASKAGGGTGKVGAELGGLLAVLGLAKATVNGEVRADYEKILETTSSLSVENKIGLLLAFLKKQGELTDVFLDAHETEDMLAQAVTATRFQLIMGEFVFVRSGERVEIQSARTDVRTGKPFVRVPLLDENMVPNQGTQVFWADEGEAPEPWPQEMFCRCTPRQGWLLANPIAIWLPDAADSRTATWSTGQPIARSPEP